MRSVDSESHGDRRVVAEQPRTILDMIVGTKVGRWVERIGLADLDVAVDPVGAKCTHRFAVAIEADDVPVSALR